MAEEEEASPLGIVIDGGFGEGVDEYLALTVLHAAARVSESKVSLAAVNVSYPSLASAQFVDALGTVYSEYAGRKLPERFRRGWSRLPVGLSDNGSPAAPPACVKAALDRKNSDGEPLFKTSIKDLNDTAISAALIRNALTAEEDQNALIVLTGPATALVQTEALNHATDIIATKVKTLVVGGDLSGDVAAANKLFSNWPSPIVAIAPSTAEAVQYPLASLADGFTWMPEHPLVDVYKAAGGAVGPATPATLAAFYAVTPDAAYWKLSEPGTLQYSSDGAVRLEPSADGKQRLVEIADGQQQAALDALTALVRAEPAEAPVPGFLKRLLEREKLKKEEEEQKQQEQKQAAPKPESR